MISLISSSSPPFDFVSFKPRNFWTSLLFFSSCHLVISHRYYYLPRLEPRYNLAIYDKPLQIMYSLSDLALFIFLPCQNIVEAQMLAVCIWKSIHYDRDRQWKEQNATYNTNTTYESSKMCIRSSFHFSYRCDCANCPFKAIKEGECIVSGSFFGIKEQ